MKHFEWSVHHYGHPYDLHKVSSTKQKDSQNAEQFLHQFLIRTNYSIALH